ncbi:MAG: CCA tRNA nucleotidyltransferase [Pseudomonadota bacterium]
MKIDAPWLSDPRTGQVFDMLEAAGYTAYFVGGLVRNAALGLGASDIDMATDARPEAVMDLAVDTGLKAVPTGIAHGTVTIVVDGLAHEVTTFRKDVETDGRRAVVAFTDVLAEDAQRRDFTINALYADRDGQITDPTGGLNDIAQRRIRFVGNAEDRVREDYLRSLRYFRMHAFYGDAEAGFDADALAAIAAGLDGLETLSAERVGGEMLRLLAAPDPAPALATMGQMGVFVRLLPGAAPDVVARLVHAEAKRPPKYIRRLAALGGEDVGARLRLSRQDEKTLSRLRAEMATTTEIAELAWRHGGDFACDVALLRAATFESHLPANTADRIALGSAAVFPIEAADLMQDFEGAALGAKLAELETRWIESDFSLSREDLLTQG